MGTVRYVMLFDAPLERVYASWRDPERLAAAFEFVDSVEVGEGTITLRYDGLFGKRRDLCLKITEEVEERCLAWQADAFGVNGSIDVNPRGAQTYVTFVLGWRPPFGRIGDTVGGWIGFPRKALVDGLARFAEIAKKPL